jgi:pyrroline-5-carboxylate reductase
MGEALVRGLLRAGWATASELVVVESAAGRRDELRSVGGPAADHPELRVVAEAVEADGVILAVKPADAPAACVQVAAAGCRRVLSILAGVTTAALERWLISDGRLRPDGTPPAAGPPVVVRAMPNSPALIGAGASAISGGSAAGPADIEWARGILSAVGTVVTVSERDLDAVTGLSGSGPAYVFLMAEALIDAGVLVGLAQPVARQLALQTLLGSARMLTETAESPAALRAAVTSPGGTTAAAVRELEAAGLRAALLDAVSAATQRAKELGATDP